LGIKGGAPQKICEAAQIFIFPPTTRPYGPQAPVALLYVISFVAA